MANINTGAVAAGADNIVLAVFAIVFGVFWLSLGDATIKHLSTGFVLWQIFVMRSLVALPFLLLFMVIAIGGVRLMPARPGWAALRSLLLVFSWVAYYAALPHLQLSLAAAAFYTAPIFMVLLSPVLLGDRVGRLGWVAVLIGFLGVVLILRPEASDFNLYALLPLVAALLYALAVILTRTHCRQEHPLTLTLAFKLAFILVGGLGAMTASTGAFGSEPHFLSAPWTPMGMLEWLAMLLLAGAILAGSIGAAVAYQSGPPRIIGVFDFSYVGFSALWGILIFSEVPDAASLLGLGLIIFSGVLTVRR